MGNARWDEADIVAESPASGERRVLRSGGSDARYLPTGHLVDAQEAVLYAVPLDLDRLEVMGAPVPVVQGVRRAVNPAGATGSANDDVANNGTLVYALGSISGRVDSSLSWGGRAGAPDPHQHAAGQYAHPRVSPDGAWIAYTDQQGGAATYVQPVGEANRYQVGRDDELAHHPLWLDGNRLAYFPGGNSGAVIVDVRTEPTVAFGRPVPVPNNGLPLNVTTASLLNHDVGPDGRFVTVLSGADAGGETPADQIVIVQNWFEELKRLVPVNRSRTF